MNKNNHIKQSNKTFRLEIAITLFITTLFGIGCTNYSLSGGSLPTHLKSVQVVLFEDNTNRYDLKLSEIITAGITDEISSQKLLDIDNSSTSDARLIGTVTQYDEAIIAQTRDEIADEKKITITLKLILLDRIKSKEIINGSVSRSETYSAAGGDNARQEAFDKIIKSISEDAVLKLTSNW